IEDRRVLGRRMGVPCRSAAREYAIEPVRVEIAAPLAHELYTCKRLRGPVPVIEVSRHEIVSLVLGSQLESPPEQRRQLHPSAHVLCPLNRVEGSHLHEAGIAKAQQQIDAIGPMLTIAPDECGA